MEEIKSPSFLLALDILQGQLVILSQDDRDILLTDGILLSRVRHYRLHGHLLKAQVRIMEHICRKVQVMPCKCPADIIILLAPALSKFLELGNRQLITAAAVAEWPHPVIDVLAPIQAHDHIAHFLVAEIHYIVI